MNLLDTILNVQNGDVVRQIANRFQLDEGQARSAIGALMPALGKGIGSNAASPQGLDELIGALTRGDHGRYIDDPAAAVQPAAVEDGNGILGHIFGSKDVSRQVASRAAERSGVDSSILKSMLPVLASLAMGAMAKRGFSTGTAAQATTDEGGGLGGLLTGFLDADKDGSILDDVIGMAGRFMR
ncbi:MAG: DUF937 domain-containing protein [Gammaproteobacteria bacterium]|nr:DUF937 domain-containing protein [Gammaproteobacteria bacterium]